MGARRKSLNSKNWLQERKEILQKIKDQVHLYLGQESADLARYAQAYKSDIKRPWQVSSLEELATAIEQVSVVFGGDFHPFKQAQRSHLRILRDVVSERKAVLALECVFEKHQKVVDAFLQDQISEDDFLKQVNWHGSWGFPWVYYKPLFELAKKFHLPVVALNTEVGERTEASLNQRDKKAAQLIADTHQNHPDSLIYVIYGDLHIATRHIPLHLKKHPVSGRDIETLSLYLNSERIYFELAERGEENNIEVVKFNEREFCLLSSPPWVKWHSYLMYLEENFDVDLHWEEDEDWEFQIDHTDHVFDLVKMISAALGVQLKGDDIEVYSMNDPQALIRVERLFNKEKFDLAHRLIKEDRSFYLPEQGFFYLSKSTVNHAATLAGQYVHAQLSAPRRLHWDFPQNFIQAIWIEAMSFMLSKFVNPKRKAQTMGDLKKQLEAFSKQDQGREPLLLALDQKMAELLIVYAGETKNKVFTPVEKSSYVHAAKFIGEILGDRFFQLYQQQILDIDNIRQLLIKNLHDLDFHEFYYQQLKLVDLWESKGKPKQ